MPFTTPDDREKMKDILAIQGELASLMADIKPGDLCYLEYRRLMHEWKKNPRWTTVDSLLAPIFQNENERAFFLAFLVFFALHVMPYEAKMRANNGDVTGED